MLDVDLMLVPVLTVNRLTSVAIPDGGGYFLYLVHKDVPPMCPSFDNYAQAVNFRGGGGGGEILPKFGIQEDDVNLHLCLIMILSMSTTNLFNHSKNKYQNFPFDEKTFKLLLKRCPQNS